MATREQIFQVLAAASGAMTRAQLEEKVGESYRKFQTQLDRWVKQELIQDTGNHTYILTDKGREEALNEELDEIPDEEPEAGPAGAASEKREATQRTVGATDYQQFMRLGRNVGVVPSNLIKVATDHIWEGGNYQDLKWVAVGLHQMAIQPDLANRWFHAWASHLKMALPTDLPQEFLAPEARKAAEKEDAAKKDGAGKRDYNLDENDNPVYVGEGLGGYDHAQAFEIGKIRAGRGKGGTSSSTGSMADEISKVFKAFKEMSPEVTQGKSFIVKTGADGTYQVEEADLSKPIVMPAPVGTKAADSYLVDDAGQVQKLEAGKPIVIVRNAPAPPGYTQGQKTIVIDKRTGETSELAPGSPLVIIRESSGAPQTGLPPVQVLDKDGKPMVMDINTLFALEDHKENIRRQNESHETKMEIAKGFKDLLKTAEKALGHMAEGEE